MLSAPFLLGSPEQCGTTLYSPISVGYQLELHVAITVYWIISFCQVSYFMFFDVRVICFI